MEKIMKTVVIIIAIVFFLISFALAYQIFKKQQKGVMAFILLALCVFIFVIALYLIFTNSLTPINYNIPMST